ncbi:MAG TPA: YidC/Oxa1 family membrane protein insertase [Candidatus Saccharimonadales bacterium]
MFTTLIVQPIFNLLVFIYALLPGHNFGLAIILFTVVIRLLMWPLVKKQLRQVKLMRKIQPELKKIKKAAAGDKRKESLLMMELYKERGINPFGQIGIILVQIPILFGLYLGLQRVLKDPHDLINFAYPFLQDLSWLKQLGSNIELFDHTLVGLIDLTRPALSNGGIYWPALMLVAGSAVAQFFQSRQLAPTDKDARSLRTILREAKEGKQADQSEVNAAMARSTTFLLPALVFVFTIHLASALSLYWLATGLVAIYQQGRVLREDVEDMDTVASTSTKATDRAKKAIEAEIVESKPKKKASTKKAARKKRRK